MAQTQPRLTPRQQRAHYKVRAAITDLEMGEPKTARTKLEEALDLDHECVDARLWLAHVLLEEGEAAAALQQYETGLVFTPDEPRLLEGLQAIRAAAKEAATPEGRDRARAKQRLVPNIVLAALIPPSGVVLGLWEIAFGRTKEWKDLGLKTLLTSVAAMAAWVIILGFLGVILGGLEPTPPS
jgi:tetratricopeptide (TPR) repeat protein